MEVYDKKKTKSEDEEWYSYYDGPRPPCDKTIEELKKEIAEIRELEKHMNGWERC